MKNTLSIILIFYLALINAQIQRYFYSLDVSNPKTKSSYSHTTALHVENEKCTFLDSEFYVVDSLNSVNRMERSTVVPRFKPIVEYFPNNGKFIFYKYIGRYYSFPKEVKLKWKIEKEKKTIGKYTVRKAVTEYGGRNWTAWFAQEIPLSFGPYVFHGLPGLVLEVSDDNQEFVFKFLYSKNSSFTKTIDFRNLIDPQPYSISFKDWKKVQKNYFQNPLAEEKKPGSRLFKSDGSVYSNEEILELEKEYKKRLIEDYHPLELDEKIEF